MTGFVSFVSSGPGDPELLTVKAVERLKRADAILLMIYLLVRPHMQNQALILLQ